MVMGLPLPTFSPASRQRLGLAWTLIWPLSPSGRSQSCSSINVSPLAKQPELDGQRDVVRRTSKVRLLTSQPGCPGRCSRSGQSSRGRPGGQPGYGVLHPP
jgi:hypothetical protein